MSVGPASLTCLFLCILASCGMGGPDARERHSTTANSNHMDTTKLDTITFGSGCFWCTEAVFQSLEGVYSAVSGYMGGQTDNPTYKEVCSGTTGHAEVVQVTYDPAVITYEELLEAFWSSHDPTTLNRQGNDVGTQYRSVIFYHSQEQRDAAVAIKADLISRRVFDRVIVTEISPAAIFYPAENYHQEYYELNGSEPYCQFVIRPKLEKFKKAFSDKLKK
ncbi:MAG: peptide-methionine (S)-S-oxide reductase MsrA [Bacteroidota bacterium]|jgi:peptide-methionine (S)-S-oxide reductase